MNRIYGSGYSSARYELRPRMDLKVEIPMIEEKQLMSGKGLEEKVTSKIAKLSLEPKSRKPKNICFELK
tara:strand:+ start:432 stop:638 length:207 start_codon:yes stop_codon:yes gene_type:complete